MRSSWSAIDSWRNVPPKRQREVLALYAQDAADLRSHPSGVCQAIAADLEAAGRALELLAGFRAADGLGCDGEEMMPTEGDAL
ncbi:MAG: hypothetical protein RLP09_09730 [Sandaracinaceae bacterium]